MSTSESQPTARRHPSPPFKLLAILLAGFFSWGGLAFGLEPRINEFLASNQNGLADEDGDESDWVEIYNPNGVAVNLNGWYLTDDLGALTKWQFPAVTINPNGYLVVFASGKNRRVPTATLHTNFNLSAGGESIALVKPDGITIVSQFTFGPQSADISYGPAAVTSTVETVIAENAPVRAKVPTDNSLALTWTNTGFNDATWTSGPWAVGYENETGYESLIGLNVKTPMNGINTSCYIRAPFNVADLSDVISATLSVRYDDGFVPYINGQVLPNASRNQPGTLTWNSQASQGNPDGDAVLFEDIDLTEYISAIHTGVNILAIHGLNVDASSSDFLIGAKLTLTHGTYTNGFMVTPTPGGPNQVGVQGFVADTKFSVDRGFYTNPFTVTITCATPGATIRYTRNGNAPTSTTGFVYSGPITVDATTILRAAAFKPGFASSNVDTQTYLFLNDILTQSANGAAPTGWPASSVNGQKFDYGMDPNVVTGREATIKSALQAIPTVSIVTDLANLVDPATGIYVNSTDHGDEWERPASLEIINDSLNPSVSGFQQNSGLRIRGGFSRDPNNPKHSLRLFFRSAYGKGKMTYALFGTAGPNKFDGFDLRTAQDASWAYLGSNQTTFLRDEVSRETQVATGMAGSHNRYVHVYLNGQYWGLYDTDERPDASFGETYLGGSKDEYDVLKSAGSTGGYQTEATDGTMATGSAWEALWLGARQVRTNPTNANYFKLMGLAADGVTKTTDPILLDVDNLADYMMVLFTMGCDDSAVSDFVGASNNWFGLRRRGGRKGFNFVVHDFEQSLGLDSGTNQRVGSGANVAPWSNVLGNAGDYTRSNPEYMHEDLAPNLEYRVKFGDRVHRLLFNNGPLSDAAVQARIASLATAIDVAIWGESARWGDAQREPAFTRTDWLSAKDDVAEFITFGTTSGSGTGRKNRIITQLRAYDSGTKPLYPTTEAPVFSQHGGSIPAGGTSITMTNPNTGTSTIYYTINGVDPRVVGGAVAPSAIAYTGAVAINATTVTLKSRILKAGVWSALNEAVFAKTGSPLRITELMPTPSAPSPSETAAGYTDKDEFEYIELTNTGATSLNVRNCRFGEGVSLTLNDATLAAGERAVVVRNLPAFQLRYGNSIRVLGEYVGNLDDGGEQITLLDPLGNVLTSLTYDNKGPWPTLTAGRGLTLRRLNLDASLPGSWRPSVAINGSPANTDSVSFTSWKAARGVTNENIDSELDGIFPILEFAIGGSPGSSDQGRLPVATVTTDAAGLVTAASYTYTRGPGTDELDPAFETSPDVTTWTPVTVVPTSITSLADGSEKVVCDVPIGQPAPAKLFIRMRWNVVP